MQSPSRIPSTPINRPRPAVAQETDLNHPFIKLYCAHCGRRLPVKLNCGDRTCPTCRKKWFGYHFKTILDCISEWKAVYFLTLTVRNIPDQSFGRYNVDRIRSCFSKFRASFKSILGGFYVVQATNRGKGWHLHLHVLFDGTFLPKNIIADAWEKITGGSYIIDIKLVQNPKTAVRYLLSDFLQSPRIRDCDYSDFNGVFRGSRLVQPFGKYRKTKFRRPYVCPDCGCCEWILLDDLFDSEEKRRFYQEDS